MRQKIIAGNWKMHKTYTQAINLTKDLLKKLKDHSLDQKLVILCPPFIHLQPVSELIKDVPHVHSGGQNCHQEVEGAFTGEISALGIKSVGADYLILGHSERRHLFGETDELIAQKVEISLGADLEVIFCCGERLKERQDNQHFHTVREQIQNSLFHLPAEDFSKIMIAYEPVWAIGTGHTATPDQAQEIHAFIRDFVTAKYGNEIGDNLHILYGGSVKPGNAAELFSQPDIDGALVGGASLKSEDFFQIIQAAG